MELQARPNFTRANSSGRVHSREQVAKRLAPLQQYPQKDKAAGKGFSLHPASKDRGDKTHKGTAAAVVTAADGDEDEFAQAQQDGLIDAELAERVREAGRCAVEVIRAWGPPFSEDWQHWRPDPAWTVPPLPQDWDRIPERMSP